MTRWILLTGIVAMGIAAIVFAERGKVDAPASPAAMLYLVADTEHELTRMPSRFARMSDAEEIRIGDETARMYGEPNTSDRNKSEIREIEKYLNQVGAPLAARAHRRLPYRFHYIPNEYMINAFALPGGHVYVGAGLLALLDSEDELSAVLGHEIEHIDHYHCAERAQQEQALRHIPLGELVAIPVMVFEAGYSKDQELEADREGTRLAVEAGYSAGGAVRLFEAFDRLYGQYMGSERVRSPQEELSQVAQQTLQGYFRSHPLPRERTAQIEKLMAEERWSVTAERDLAVAYIFWTQRAAQAFELHKYPQAAELASRSLKMHPEQPSAWNVMARAQFAQADFSGAARSYRKLLDAERNVSHVGSYAMALAAADRHGAAAEFRGWTESVHDGRPRNVEVEEIGLRLLTGDSAAAHKYEEELQVSSDNWAPDYQGELGWWYYLAGDYERASQLLAAAVQQRPGDIKLWVHRAWTEIEIRRYSDAIQTVNNGRFESGLPYEEHPQGERAMAQGVAFWLAKETDEALRDYDRAIAVQPEWENPQWVKALYSPLVAQSVQGMHDEKERRKKANVAEKR